MAIRSIIPIISGKGGVGKSTVAVNLAVALGKTGAKVALIDCDVYGPSVPTLMGGGDLQVNEQGIPIPPVKYGIKYISLGFFLKDPDQAIMWRGPMLHKAVTQLFSDVSWGEVDYAIVDMPPGTGDAQISLSQVVQVTGAVVVTTPQEVALADVRKAMNMLRKVNIDIFGIVENMSSFMAPDGSQIAIFGEGGGERTASQFGVPLLCEFPLDPIVRVGGDTGEPVAWSGNGVLPKKFDELAGKIIQLVDEKIASKPAVRLVNSEPSVSI